MNHNSSSSSAKPTLPRSESSLSKNIKQEEMSEEALAERNKDKGDKDEVDVDGEVDEAQIRGGVSPPTVGAGAHSYPIISV